MADGVGGAAAADALTASGVLAPVGPPTWFPCRHGRPGCRQSVSCSDKTLTTRCGRSTPECEALVLDARGIAAHGFVELAFAALLQQLFDAGTSAIFRERDVLLLGRSFSEAGALVWLWIHPQESRFSLWMHEQERRAARALVLVPTGETLHQETFERYGAGRPVSIVHLDRVLTIDSGRIVRRQEVNAPARVPWQPRQVERTVARVRTPAGTTWREIAIEYVDADVVGIRVRDFEPIRLTAGELGLTRVRTAQLSDQWHLLRGLCEGSGTCTRAQVGAPSMDVLSKRAGRLGAQLAFVLDMATNPLHLDTSNETVSSEFRAHPEPLRTASRRNRELSDI
ncbi:MAG TPA: hypothetical protein VGG39_37535 [Polyangiaceae bacterium]